MAGDMTEAKVAYQGFSPSGKINGMKKRIRAKAVMTSSSDDWMRDADRFGSLHIEINWY